MRLRETETSDIDSSNNWRVLNMDALGKTLRVATLTVALLVGLPAMAGGGHGKEGICSRGGHAYTRAIAVSQQFYWPWNLGASNRQTVGPLFMVPLPEGTPVSDDPFVLQGSTSFDVKPGRTLVLPLSVYIGESYDDGTVEDPADVSIDFAASTLILTVDGRVIADSSRSSIDCLDFGTVRFAQPIVYPTPTDYGAVAAVWVKGLGVLLPPLRPGDHQIDLQVVSPTAAQVGVDVGYYNTWYVHVGRR